MGEIEWIVLTEDEKRLYSRLTAHRRSIANGCGVDDEEVLTNAELVWLVHYLPTTLEAVRTIPGMCAKRADKWSASFLPILSGRAPRRREHSEPPKGALSKEQRELLRRLKALHKAEWDGIHANGPGEWAGGSSMSPHSMPSSGASRHLTSAHDR